MATAELLKLIDNTNKILITSHTSPDPDAVASLLLVGTTLITNYPQKNIQMTLEEEPSNLSFLTGYKNINFQKIDQAIESFQPDLFIIVDANSYRRVSREGGKEIQRLVLSNKIKTVIIDHHEPDDKDPADVYLNSTNPAAVQEVYELCFEHLNLKKPAGYANTTMTGLYSDTGGFAYKNPNYKQTFKLASDLVAAGADIEAIKNRLNQFSEDQTKVLSELLANLQHKDGYTYTFLPDEFVQQWVKSQKPLSTLDTARKKFVDEYIRNIDGRQWGFLVCLDPKEAGHCYSVSLRAVAGVKDVAAIARRLNGGGHKPAAGGKIEAKNLQEAIEKVQAAIIDSA